METVYMIIPIRALLLMFCAIAVWNQFSYMYDFRFAHLFIQREMIESLFAFCQNYGDTFNRAHNKITTTAAATEALATATTTTTIRTYIQIHWDGRNLRASWLFRIEYFYCSSYGFDSTLRVSFIFSLFLGLAWIVAYTTLFRTKRIM